MSDTVIKKEAIVIHSGGMDSSLCLAQAIKEHGKDNVLSLSFSYNQRHSIELKQAKKISHEWGVDHYVINLCSLQEITTNALMDQKLAINHSLGKPPNTLVTGRNGLMARLGAIHADHLGASLIYMGIIEVESANSGYRDCSRHYMDLLEEILRIDLDNPQFEIRTPVVFMTKKETLELGLKLEVLEFLLEETITCYEGLPKKGCQICPACKLKNEGLEGFSLAHPTITLPY